VEESGRGLIWGAIADVEEPWSRGSDLTPELVEHESRRAFQHDHEVRTETAQVTSFMPAIIMAVSSREVTWGGTYSTHGRN
jgi:hypothetical protein